MAGKKVKDYAAEVGVTGPELAKILLDMKVEGVRSAMSSLDEATWEKVKPEVLEKAEPIKKKASAKKPAAKKTAKKEDEGEKSEAEAPKMKIVRKKAAAKKPAAEESAAPAEGEAPAPAAEAKPAEAAPAPEAKVEPAAKPEPAPAPEAKPAEAAPAPEAKPEPAANPAPEAKPAEKPAEPASGPIIRNAAEVEAERKAAIEAERRKAEEAAARQHVELKVKVEKPSDEFAARIARYAAQRNAARPAGDRGPRRDGRGPGFTGTFGRPQGQGGPSAGRPGPGGPRRPGGPAPEMNAPSPDAAKRGGHGSGPKGSAKKHQKGEQRQQEQEHRLDPKQSVNRVMAQLSKTPSRHHHDHRDDQAENAAEERRVLRVSDFITVSELAGLLGVLPARVIAKCMELGMMVTINQRIDFETIQLLALEFGCEAQLMDEYEDAEGEEEAADESALVGRPPVVTVMGHVDHGKTSLLDYIRKAHVARGEEGGITQHVGAYRVETAKGMVTFLDTPGHEAFSAMRARGSQITDVIVLVVAADSMVMPQTVESIDHAKSAKVPIVVAITKCDLETANPDRIRAQLAEHGVNVEQWGGQTSCVEVSSKTGKGMDTLLETLALETEILELKANPDMEARGVVIESRLDKGKGAVATVLVQNGTLRVGDPFVAGIYSGKVRALLDENGAQIKTAGPGCPCQIMGLDGAPFAGDKLTVHESEKEAREIAGKRRAAAKERELRSHHRITLGEVYDRVKSGNFTELNVVVKADVDGSAEALTQELEKLSNKEVAVNIIRKAVGNINESDVQLAAASNAIIVAFHLLPAPAVRSQAEEEGVEIKQYRIIYDCVEEFKNVVEGMLKPIVREEVAGEAEVKQLFHIPKVGLIAGCVVTNGTVDLEAKLRIYRKGREIGVAKVTSLKRHQEEVTSVKAGFECGIGVGGVEDVQVDDTLAFFKEVKIKRTLADVK